MRLKHYAKFLSLTGRARNYLLEGPLSCYKKLRSVCSHFAEEQDTALQNKLPETLEADEVGVGLFIGFMLKWMRTAH